LVKKPREDEKKGPRLEKGETGEQKGKGSVPQRGTKSQSKPQAGLKKGAVQTARGRETYGEERQAYVAPA